MGSVESVSTRVPAVREVARDAETPRPTVSIVVPVLNGERFLRESLESILGQTYAPAEVIVMDDGSTDSTRDIVSSYGDRMRYVGQPTTRGIYGNANDGIALATGDLVGVFHADDVYLPAMLEQEVEWLEHNEEAGAVFCSDVFVDADGRELGRLELPPEIRGGRPLGYETVLNALLTYKNRFLRCPSALVRASVYAELGGYRDEEFKNTSDLELWLRIARTHPIGVLEDHLMLYRRGHGSSSERYHALRTEPERFFTIMDLELARSPGVATEHALHEYEAHRSQDATMRAMSLYVRGDRRGAAQAVREARLSTLLRSSEIQGRRMAVLALSLKALVRLPRVAALARVFERRWGGPANPVGSC